MGESFQDYSWIQDFEADFTESQPQNAELGSDFFYLRVLRLRRMILTKDAWF